MTLEIMQAVVNELKRRAVPATLEYPGVISVTVAWSGTRHDWGGANETIMGDVVEVPEECIETIDSGIPSDSTDVQRIADWIAVNYTTACGNAPQYAIPERPQ